MCSNKYIISLTTIPSRIYNIENTIKSLVEQTLKPERIILNIPKKYNFRFNSSIDDITIKKILNKYIDKLTINYIEHDYGPGTKLVGLIKNNVINYKSNSVYIVLVDDDNIYKPYMLEYFDNYNKNYNNKLKCSSFYCYNNNGITIGQGSDGLFIRLELLNQFENYYNIIKDNDYINYHDDYYISYYFDLKQIQMEYIKPPDNTLIYTKHINSDIDALLSIHNKNNRNNLNDKLNEILNKLNIEDKFNEIKNDLDKIPKNIILTWKNSYEIPNYVINKWKILNPEFTIKFFDDEQIIKFFKKEYNDNYILFFNNIKFGRYKSDFFRYCYLYKYGGYYFDIDIEPILPINNIIDIKANYITILSNYVKGHIYQGILIVKKNDSIIKMCIDDMLYYGSNIGIDPPDKYPFTGHPTKCMYDNIVKYTEHEELLEGTIETKNQYIVLGRECKYNNRDAIKINNKLFGYSRYLNYEREKGFQIINTVNKNNCEVITTTLSNKVSKLRKENIINNFTKYEFNINFIEGIKYDNWGKNEQYESTLNMLIRFEKSNYEYGIICQDDFFPIDNFLQELNNTIQLLPKNWECLHLSPGFLWGRKYRDKLKIGDLNPEFNINIMESHGSGRFFINCKAEEYYKKNMWLGGPIAILINKQSINKIIKTYKENFDHDDRTLVRILNNNTFICRQPQLGYEEECGKTSN